MSLSINNPPDGAQKTYPGANGYFVDAHGWVWEVCRIALDPPIFARWDYDGTDPGASFTEHDGNFYPFGSYAPH